MDLSAKKVASHADRLRKCGGGTITPFLGVCFSVFMNTRARRSGQEDFRDFEGARAAGQALALGVAMVSCGRGSVVKNLVVLLRVVFGCIGLGQSVS